MMDRVIFDDSGILVSYIGLVANEDGLNVQLYIENNTRRAVSIDINEVSVNDFIMDPSFSCDIAARKRANAAIEFDNDDLEENGIEFFETIEFTINVCDEDTLDDLFNSGVITLNQDDLDPLQIRSNVGYVVDNLISYLQN